MNEMTN